MSSCCSEIALPDLSVKPQLTGFSAKAIDVISGFALKPMQDRIFCHMCVTGFK